MSEMFFPKWSPSGKLAYETGRGSVVVDGQEVAPAWGVSWASDSEYVYFNDSGVWSSTRGQLYLQRVSELAAGGGHWAARRGDGVLIMDGNAIHDNAGQPSFDFEGNLIYNDGTKFEPTIAGPWRAWVENGGVRVEHGFFLPGEGRPRLIDTHDRTLLVTMTQDSIRVRVLFVEHRGWELITGVDNNWYAEPGPNGTRIAYKNGIWDVPYHLPMMSFERVVQPPPVLHPPQEPKVTPDESATVQRLWAEHNGARMEAGVFTELVAWTLNPSGNEASWGLLSKSAGEQGYGNPRHADDAIIFGATQQVVDIIGNAGGPNPSPAWQHQPKRESNNWLKPFQPRLEAPGGDSPAEPDDPQPDPSIDALAARVASLEAQLEGAQEELSAAAELFAQLIARIEKLEEPLKFQVSGHTFGKLGHKHEVKIDVQVPR